MTDKEFQRVFTILYETWEKGIETYTAAGFTKEKAAELVGQRFTQEFFPKIYKKERL